MLGNEEGNYRESYRSPSPVAFCQASFYNKYVTRISPGHKAHQRVHITAFQIFYMHRLYDTYAGQVASVGVRVGFSILSTHNHFATSSIM